MKKSILLALSVGLGVASVARAADQTYVWSDGAPGYSGAIVLDSDASSDGSLADVVSINVSTPAGAAALTQANISDVYVNNPDGPFTWNPSQITGMWIDWTAPGGEAGVGENYQPSIPGYNFEFYPDDSSIDFAGPIESDTTGSWQAVNAAPDGGPTCMLLGAALTGLGVSRKKLAV